MHLRLILPGFLLVLACAPLAAVAPTPTRPSAWGYTHSDCPRLGGSLLALLNERDPATFARANNLPIEDGRVLVAVWLQAPEGDLSSRHDLRVRGRASGGERIEAYAQVDRLCDLSNDPRVVSVDLVAPMLPAPKK